MSRQPRASVLLAALLVGLMFAAVATSAAAHPSAVAAPAAATVEVAAETSPAEAPAPAAVPAPAPSPSGPIVPIVVLALAVALAGWRRALVPALAVALVVLAVESGVHAVHHLADQQGASQCVVALATAQVHGTAEDPPTPDALRIDVPVGAVVALAPERPGARPPRPDEGRAPPTA